jgi:hypothetical protein
LFASDLLVLAFLLAKAVCDIFKKRKSTHSFPTTQVGDEPGEAGAEEAEGEVTGLGTSRSIKKGKK